MELRLTLSRLNKEITRYIDIGASNLSNLFKENFYLIIILSIIAIVVYGFELFNLNLTIDEEVHAIFTGPTLDWIQQGRWGMYFLNKFLLPYTILPFMPLFFALFFEILAIIILVNVWGSYSKLEKVIIGSICLAYPGIAYAYTFSTINYGIGFGFFCCALSLWLFARNKDFKEFHAIIPAVFAVSIYQGLIPVLIAVYLVYFINLFLYHEDSIYKKIIKFIAIIVSALLFSQIIEVIALRVYDLTKSNYVSMYFNFQSIKQNFSFLFRTFLSMMTRVYLGDKSIYSLELRSLAIILVVAIIGYIVKVSLSRSLNKSKIFSIMLIITLFIVPFLSGFLMNGNYAMRFLVALPIVIAGVIALGLNINSSPHRFLVLLTTIVCISQFAQSANHLFASSNLSLQDDRLLGERLIEQIDIAKFDTNDPEAIKYLWVVGYFQRPTTQLIPKLETFGASFFEWDQGNTSRIILFLQTLGYSGLETLPANRRATMIEVAKAMPVWPENGSVKVVGDTVVVKFSSPSAP